MKKEKKISAQLIDLQLSLPFPPLHYASLTCSCMSLELYYSTPHFVLVVFSKHVLQTTDQKTWPGVGGGDRNLKRVKQNP